jgi:signal transduction histidine kinase
MGRRIAAWLAGGMCAATLAAIAGALVLARLNHIGPDALTYLVFVAACALVGGLVAAHRPDNAVGWLFAGGGLCFALTELTGEYAIYGLITHPNTLPMAGLMAWLQAVLVVPAVLLLLAFAPFYFPDGRLPSPRWRPVARLQIVVAGAMVLLIGVLPTVPREAGGNGPDFTNPLGIAALRPLVTITAAAKFPLLALMMLAALVALVLRFRRATGEERAQLMWLAYAVAATLVVLVAAVAGRLVLPRSPAVGAVDALSLPAVCAIPVAVGVAILRYRLYDIDLLINRTLVYGGLTAIVVGVYVLLVGGLGTLLQARGNPLLALAATGFIAAVFAPLRERLQRGANRVLYGDRDEPYAAIARLGQRLEETLAPEAVLPTVVQTVRDALRLPFVAVEAEGRVVASSGSPTARALRVPLVYQGTPVGGLVLAPRAGSEAFSSADRRLLDDLARQAGIAVHAARVTADLQRARERLVAAREEERRRLRRDLHDGLGSRLAALALQADVLRTLIPRDPAAAAAAVVELRGEIRAAIADIRRVAYDLRPPALDELGLVAAIQQRAARYSVDGAAEGQHAAPDRAHQTVQVVVEAPEDLPPLPAAVEVAAYRIVEEALTNVVRHAQAQHCLVRLAVADDLCLEVCDDGIGVAAPRGAGVGLHSMRERAAELGGTWTLEPRPGGGTRVRVRLPVGER